MRRRDSNPNLQQGFTIIEAIVTIIILSIFLLGFFQAFSVMESQRVNLLEESKASDIAYINLRKFPSKGALTCDASTMTGNPASGYTLTFTPEQIVAPLNSHSTQVVKAYAPNGCSGTAFQGGTVQIVSTVSYGSTGGQTVSHATFIQ